MRVSVCVRGDWLVVPCGDPSKSMRWLGLEALRRYARAHPSEVLSSQPSFVLKRCVDGGLLDVEDSISSVLSDNDFVKLRIHGDTWDRSHDLLPGCMYPFFFFLSYFMGYISLDGNSLTTADLVSLGKGHYKIKHCTPLTNHLRHVAFASFDFLNLCIVVVYGVNTGFGKFARSVVLVCVWAGVGAALIPERTRMLLALRINTLAKGYSGVSLETLQKMLSAFNASCLSWVPEKGTVGASGDLAPLAHLALGLMGEGQMWSPNTGWTDARTVLEGHGLTPISLKPKEGLALINGTQMMSSLGAEAVERAEAIARQADVIAALTLEVLRGTNKAFDNEEKPYDRVQDAYTLRCCPQVHGVANDTIAFVKKILNTELNSSTDNPLVFAERGITISGGNFHGEYPAKALDFLSIGVHELASISERRIERMCNPSLSDLPAFLVKEGGFNSGFMIAHCTAAALVSENKVLCHPASVDSLSTSAATEDHVSMGGWAARKALRVVEHVEQVLAIELLAACQALEFFRPLGTTAPLERVYELLRTVVRPWDKDRVMSSDIEVAHKLLLEEKVSITTSIPTALLHLVLC
uniref:Histidine ammonia-lyase n=1 Tax=Electrophorus electricus TaxID=8005 RepID=A0A4W4DPE8_ELEEL